MRQDKYGKYIFYEKDMLNTLMKCDRLSPGPFPIVDLPNINEINELVQYEAFEQHTNNELSVVEFDNIAQHKWFMPKHYKQLDIAKYILDQCDTTEELQRCGEELLMYQERDMFDLLRYMVYLVNTMTKHKIIWGVGRGSSVASFVLYKLKVHRINSMDYKLRIDEFLR